jgi:hypothetical protein
MVLTQHLSFTPVQTLFTDGAKAIANAIEVVFPATVHALCWWHIKYKGAPANITNAPSKADFTNLVRSLEKAVLVDDSSITAEAYDNAFLYLKQFTIEWGPARDVVAGKKKKKKRARDLPKGKYRPKSPNPSQSRCIYCRSFHFSVIPPGSEQATDRWSKKTKGGKTVATAMASKKGKGGKKGASHNTTTKPVVMSADLLKLDLATKAFVGTAAVNVLHMVGPRFILCVMTATDLSFTFSCVCMAHKQGDPASTRRTPMRRTAI